MKQLAIFIPMLGLSGLVGAQEKAGKEEEVRSEETSIQGPIADGTVPEPALKEPEPEFEVIRSTTKRVEVTESPELPGLPAPEGTINMTMQLVEDPGLPRLEKPLLPQFDVNDPLVQERISAVREKFKETKILLISASVYDRRKTLLKVYPNGAGAREVTVISNLDFNDFSGFATWQLKGVGADGTEEVRQYANVMALGNSDSDELSQVAEEQGLEVRKIPDAPAGDDPAFTVVEGEDAEALQAVADLHDLYRVEGANMRTARIARERAYEERMAFLLETPPKPKDVTFRFWKRGSTSGSEPNLK